MPKKRSSENYLVNSYCKCVLFKKYYQYNLWFGSFVEYYSLKYCREYIEKYIYCWIFFSLLQHFSLFFVIFLYRSFHFAKFVESGFLKYLDYQFLVLFYNICSTFDSKGKQKIINFVKFYFRKHLKIRLEKDLLIIVTKAINETILNVFFRYLNNRLKIIHIYKGRIKSSDKRLVKLVTAKNKKSYSNLCFIDFSCFFFFKFFYFFKNLKFINFKFDNVLKFNLKSVKVNKLIMEKTFIDSLRKGSTYFNKDILYLLEVVKFLDRVNIQEKNIGLYKNSSILFKDSLIQKDLLLDKCFKNINFFFKSFIIYFVKYKGNFLIYLEIPIRRNLNFFSRSTKKTLLTL